MLTEASSEVRKAARTHEPHELGTQEATKPQPHTMGLIVSKIVDKLQEMTSSPTKILMKGAQQGAGRGRRGRVSRAAMHKNAV